MTTLKMPKVDRQILKIKEKIFKTKKTINYSEIYKFTKKFISGTNYYLIETLGDNLAKKIIEKFGVKKISLELFKPSVYEDDETVSIRLERELK